MANSNLQLLWSNAKCLDYLLPDLSSKMVDDIEMKIGHKLPSYLIELLKIQNGGFIRYGHPKLGLIGFLGIGDGRYTINEFHRNSFGNLPAGFITINRDHFDPVYLCLDYSQGEEPAVVCFNSGTRETELVAASFGQFIDGLIIAPCTEWVIDTEDSLEDILIDLEYILEIQFEKPLASMGHWHYSAQHKDGMLFLCCNSVSESYTLYSESQMAEAETLTFPELNARLLFIDIHPPHLDEVAEKLKKFGVPLKSFWDVFPENKRSAPKF